MDRQIGFIYAVARVGGVYCGKEYGIRGGSGVVDW